MEWNFFRNKGKAYQNQEYIWLCGGGQVRRTYPKLQKCERCCKIWTSAYSTVQRVYETRRNDWHKEIFEGRKNGNIRSTGRLFIVTKWVVETWIRKWLWKWWIINCKNRKIDDLQLSPGPKMLWKYVQYKCDFHQKQIVLWFPKIVNHVLRKVFCGVECIK